MMKLDKMPTTFALLILSWLAAFFGFILSGYLVIFKSQEVNILIYGLSILLGSFILAATIRMFGNIGQMLFDIKNFLFNSNQTLNSQFQSIHNELQNLKNIYEQIGCDSKDINQNIHQIKTFFERIERHIDLKK